MNFPNVSGHTIDVIFVLRRLITLDARRSRIQPTNNDERSTLECVEAYA